MRYLFLPGVDLSQPTVSIGGADAHHLAVVLRARLGDRIVILDNRGAAVEAEVEQVGKREVLARVRGPVELAPEPPVTITVGQALGKGDKLEQVIQHGTEAGASGFIPVLAERSIAKQGARNVEEKLGRWRAIAKGAAEQAGRARIPLISPPSAIGTLASRFSEFNSVLILDPLGEPLWTFLSAQNTPSCSDAAGLSSAIGGTGNPCILLLVGPEGGFTPRELEQAIGAGAGAVRLGEHVLRTETAALVALSQLMFASRVGMLRGMAE